MTVRQQETLRLGSLSAKALTRARRMMALGLIVSVLGDRVVNGGVDGLIVAGALPVIWVAISTTASEVVVFAFPAYARMLKRFSPDRALIVEDLAEAILAVTAIAFMIAWPEIGLAPLVGYLVILKLLTPVSDIADEYYGAKLAQVDEKAALAYNASISAALSIAGFVIAVPLGSIIASQSVLLVLLVNVILSLAGAAVRARISRDVHIGPAIDGDESEFDVSGSSMALRQFFHDLFRSGPASPLVSFVLGIIGALTGHLLLIWAAALVPADPFTSTAAIFFVFGVSAAVGPLLATRVRDRLSVGASLVVTASVSFVNIAWFALFVWLSPQPTLIAAIVFIVVNVVSGRLRSTVLETHRQRFFKGTQYARIMSWSYAFGGAGTLIGIWVAYAVDVPTTPLWGLLIAAALWVMPTVIVASRIRPPAGVTDTGAK